MKLKCNWLILHRYILEPSLDPFKAHIQLQMSSYVNVKAIKLITLFVGFVQVYEAPGSSQTFEYSHWSPRPQWEPGQAGLEEHTLMFGAMLSKWLAKKLGHFTKLDFTQE